MSVENLYDGEIRDELENLNKMELGTEAYATTVNGVSKLTGEYIKLKELEMEQRKLDIEMEKVNVEYKKVDVEEKDRKFKNHLALGTAVSGALITVGTVLLSLVSEEKGIINSTKAGKAGFDRALNYFFKK